MASIDGVKIRKFERGASGMGTDEFLKKRGYIVRGSGNGATFTVVGPGGGRAKTLNRLGLIELVDQERRRAGLEPLRKQPVPEA